MNVLGCHFFLRDPLVINRGAIKIVNRENRKILKIFEKMFCRNFQNYFLHNEKLFFDEFFLDERSIPLLSIAPLFITNGSRRKK